MKGGIYVPSIFNSMKQNIAFLAAFALFIPFLSAQEKPKWDVSNPQGIPYHEFNFTTDEGT